jgi:methylenetetrahydrofolate--tRNA-(uracil-5-)-methyltransferase
MNPVNVVGAGLAGCEVALQLGQRGIPVRLFEMKPKRRTPAQVSDRLAELVCSNSFRSNNVGNAIGLLKWEMRHAGSAIMAAAAEAAVPAGDALAVDRDLFSAAVEAAIASHPSIELITEIVEDIPEGLTVIATGPLTDPPLAAKIAARAGKDSLYFYDAIAPIIDADSINWDIVWRQSRYDKGDGADYANVPLNRDQYFAFVQAVVDGDKVTPRAFEEAKYFEGCLPIEVMAERGPQTLSFGPLKPVGLMDTRTGTTPYAVVQLRMENREATAWNMVGFQTRLKYPDQKRIFQALPGLEQASFLRYGSVHRNTYLHAPSLLTDDLHWHDDPDLYFAGQITGVEGYVESTACGLLVAWHVLARLKGLPAPVPPPESAMGSLRRHLRGSGILSKYSPSNLNWSFFPPIDKQRREKKAARKLRQSQRAQDALTAWWASEPLG